MSLFHNPSQHMSEIQLWSEFVKNYSCTSIIIFFFRSYGGCCVITCRNYRGCCCPCLMFDDLFWYTTNNTLFSFITLFYYNEFCFVGLRKSGKLFYILMVFLRGYQYSFKASNRRTCSWLYHYPVPYLSINFFSFLAIALDFNWFFSNIIRQFHYKFLSIH